MLFGCGHWSNSVYMLYRGGGAVCICVCFIWGFNSVFLSRSFLVIPRYTEEQGGERVKMIEKQERREYFENLMQKLGITEEKGRNAYIAFLINQKKSDKWLNQKMDIEVLEEMKMLEGKEDGS